MLLTGDVDSDVCEKYPELTDQSFAVQLSMFKNTYHVNSLSDASAIFKKMVVQRASQTENLASQLND